MSVPAGEHRIHEGLRVVGGAAGVPSATLTMLMEDRHSVRLAGDEIRRVLAEIADWAPGLLHEALDDALARRVVRELEDRS